MSSLSKTPFLFLLVPMIGGIFIQYYLHIELLSILFFVSGAALIISSYFIDKNKLYNLRWLFGLGLSFVIIGIGMLSTLNRQKKSENIFDNRQHIYKGIVINIPQDKPKSTAYKVILPDYNKKVICYFQLDSTRMKLRAGDEFIFKAAIQAFQNTNSPDDFDYEKYMYNQGFVGTAYVSKHSWAATGQTSISPQIIAQRYRQKILDFYKSMGFNNIEYGIISALTVGYQDALPEDVKQSFRTTGTVHVLSVSGLHVGIIYIMISFLLGFIKKTSKAYRFKPLLVILFLWTYAFLAGLAPSVTRASIMLTMFCLGQILNRPRSSIHSMYIAAFLILLWNPFSFFNLGFQFSFLSVIGILYLQPILSKVLIVKNKIKRHIWNSFTLSCVAQLATFPLCLYYFGTFPTYFFITNLIIIPLITLIIYSFGIIILSQIIYLLIPTVGTYIFLIPVKTVQSLLWLLSQCIHFFESLPFSLIQNVDMSFTGFVMLSLFILTLTIYLLYKKSVYLKTCLYVGIISSFIGVYNNLKTEPDSLTIYKKQEGTEIRWVVNKQNYILRNSDLGVGYKIIDIKDTRILAISKVYWKNKDCYNKFEVDYILLAGKELFDINEINKIFSFKKIILDNSLLKKQAVLLVKQLESLQIPYYNVSENGAYRIIF